MILFFEKCFGKRVADPAEARFHLMKHFFVILIALSIILNFFVNGCKKNKSDKVTDHLKNIHVEYSDDGAGGCWPELVQQKEVRQIVQQPEIWKTLINNLTSPIPTRSVFEGNAVPVGYLCLDILLMSVHDDYYLTVCTGWGDDGLGAPVREKYYFPPDVLDNPNGKYKMLAVQKAWIELYKNTNHKVWCIDEHPSYFIPVSESNQKEEQNQEDPILFLFRAVKERNLENLKHGLDKGSVHNRRFGATLLTYLFLTPDPHQQEWWPPDEKRDRQNEELAYQIMEMLLKSGTNANALDEAFGLAPLHYCLGRKGAMWINYDVSKFVDLLLRYGANPNLRSREGDTPLHLAVDSPHNTDAIRLLIDHGANVNAQNENRDTALHILLNGELVLDNLILVLQKSANVNIKNMGENTPLQVAVDTKKTYQGAPGKDTPKIILEYDKAIALLKEHGAQ